MNETLSPEDKNSPPTNEEISKSTPNPEEAKKSPEQLMKEALSDYPFVEYSNGKIRIEHQELKQYLTPKILKVGDMVKRGTTIANLSGGLTNIDNQTQALNNSIGTVIVGFVEKLNIDLLTVEDTDLIMGLYVAVVSYNTFFRKTPLGFIL